MASARTVVITGANSGIGFQASLHFARAGARVVMACRSEEKAQEAEQQIRKEVPESNTMVVPLDVSEQESIREFGHRFRSEVGGLDILINNAGIVAIPLARTSAGHEMQLATNYLGAFGLTGTLLPYFGAGGAGRIVNVGSLAHRFGQLKVDDLNWEIAEYDQWRAYANSKVALLSHTLELNRRLRDGGSKLVALAAHPGFANTGIHTKSESLTPKTALGRWYQTRMQAVVPSAAQAARSVVFAASAGDAAGGEYYGPGGLLEISGKPRRARINRIAKDADLSKKLWRLSESMTGVRYLPDP